MNSEQIKIFEEFITEATLHALPLANLNRVETPHASELVNWPEPIQVSIMSFNCDKLQGTALMGCDEAFLEQTCPGLDSNDPHKVELMQDWLGELSNLVLGRLKNKLIPYDIVLKLNPPSVSESSEELFNGYSKRKDNIKLWFRCEQQHFCVSFSVDVNDSVDFSAELPAQGHSLQPGDAIYRLSEESRASKKYDLISQIRSGVMTDDDPALHDDFELDDDHSGHEIKTLMPTQSAGVEELDKSYQTRDKARVQEPVSVGRVKGHAYPEIKQSFSIPVSEKRTSSGRRNLEGVDWYEGGVLCLRFQGGSVVRINPSVLLDRGTGSLMIEGFKIEFMVLKTGLTVTIPELQITLESSIRAA